MKSEAAKTHHQPPIKATPWKSKPAPSERVSIYLQVFPDSVEDEWTNRIGIGWTHISEKPTFIRSFVQCSISKRWMKPEEASELWSGDIVYADEAKKAGYIRELTGGKWCQAEDLLDVADGNGKEAKAHKSYYDSYLLDEVDGRRFHKSQIVKIRESRDGITWVSRYTCHMTGRFAQCQLCDKWYDKANVVLREEIRRSACAACHDNYMMKQVIRAHNDQNYPPPICARINAFRMVGGQETKLGNGDVIFIGKRRAKVDVPTIAMFGVEVEAEFAAGELGRCQLALNAIKALGSEFVFAKHDGSLRGRKDDGRGGDFGFELVSAPADMETHRKYWPKFESMEGFAQLRAWDTKTCGMHVHVSKAPLTTLQIGRIVNFVTTKRNKKFIEAIAGRPSERYCEYIEKHVSDAIRPDEDHYVAVHYKHERTVEFRIFRGTVRARHILRNIEWCEAMVAYAYPGSRSMMDMRDSRQFIAFVASNRKMWPLANEWLEYHEYIKERPRSDKSKAPPPSEPMEMVHGVEAPSEAQPIF